MWMHIFVRIVRKWLYMCVLCHLSNHRRHVPCNGRAEEAPVYRRWRTHQQVPRSGTAEEAGSRLPVWRIMKQKLGYCFNALANIMTCNQMCKVQAELNKSVAAITRIIVLQAWSSRLVNKASAEIHPTMVWDQRHWDLPGRRRTN